MKTNTAKLPSSINKTSHPAGPIESFLKVVFVKLRLDVFCRISFRAVHSPYRISIDVNLVSPVFHRCIKQSSGWGMEGWFSFMCGRWESGKYARPEWKSIKAGSFGFWVSIGFGSSQCKVLQKEQKRKKRKLKKKNFVSRKEKVKIKINLIKFET